MRYAYCDLSDYQFENLVIVICQKLLGIGVQGFSPGPDGGRDAKFIGTAEQHPSKTGPWTGTVIIQAKHTDGFNRSFSEKDFYSDDNESSIIRVEVERIRSLANSGELDHYMIFSNRRLSAGANHTITQFISNECSIPVGSIALIGIEQIERLLKVYPDIATIADLDPLDSPLIVSPQELADVVEAFAKFGASGLAMTASMPVDRVTFERKNALNGMSPEYAKAQRRLYLKDTYQIKSFLAAPENTDFMEKYGATVEEFSLQIIAKKKNHQSFDDVMEYIASQLYGRDPVLRQTNHRRITRAMLFYMYWNCDIGEVEDA